MADIMLIDDDAELVQGLARALRPRLAGLSLCAFGSPDAALASATKEDPRAVLLDLCLDDRVGVESGFAVLAGLRRLCPHARIVVLTGHGSVEHGVRAISLGAATFVEKPADPMHLAALLRDAVAQSDLRREHARLVGAAGEGVVGLLSGTSGAIKSLRQHLQFVASTPQPVLLLGETGTGKGVCARIIHELSARRGSKLVHYHPNFGGGDIVHSELFGHLRGSFTGAAASRRGLVLEADGGTLFIDELDEVPPDSQVKLLDLVQERRIRALGADSFQAVDCRFLAASNRDIDEALATGRIRRDLYHRLSACVVRLPPLRERREDIPHLARLFLARLRERDALNVFDVSREALDALAAHAWPGNVRELQGVIETAAYHAHACQESVVAPQDLSLRPREGTDVLGGLLAERVARFKAGLIAEALQAAGGNQVHAARLLGVDRGTVRRAIARSADGL